MLKKNHCFETAVKYFPLKSSKIVDDDFVFRPLTSYNKCDTHSITIISNSLYTIGCFNFTARNFLLMANYLLCKLS